MVGWFLHGHPQQLYTASHYNRLEHRIACMHMVLITLRSDSNQNTNIHIYIHTFLPTDWGCNNILANRVEAQSKYYNDQNLLNLIIKVVEKDKYLTPCRVPSLSWRLFILISFDFAHNFFRRLNILSALVTYLLCCY